MANVDVEVVLAFYYPRVPPPFLVSICKVITVLVTPDEALLVNLRCVAEFDCTEL